MSPCVHDLSCAHDLSCLQMWVLRQAERGDFFGATYYKLLAGGSGPMLALYAACDESNTSSASEMVRV